MGYRNDGKLASVSYPEGYDHSFRKETMGLIPLPRMANYRGFIFGSIAPTGMSLEVTTWARHRERSTCSSTCRRSARSTRAPAIHKYQYRGNWKLQIENSMDGYHPNFVHKTFFGMMGRAA